MKRKAVGHYSEPGHLALRSVSRRAPGFILEDGLGGRKGWTAGSMDFDEEWDGAVSNEDRDGIRGRNTWLLWGGGNEAFWAGCKNAPTG